jgi:hypothetical protein
MRKGHYPGGSTLVGRGTIVKAKGRSGGIGQSGAALREQRHIAERKRKREAAEKIKANTKLVRKLGKQWAAEKGRKQYERLALDQRVKVAPLAAALRAALEANDKEG